MKKIFFIFGIIVVVLSLTLISGCTERGPDTAPETSPEPLSTDEEITETTEETNVTSPNGSSDVSKKVSKEDLDRLKEDLEELEYEDLGGLTEE